MDSVDLTVLIPIGLAHREISERAVESVKKQTIPTNLLTWTDHDQRGPGYARNRLLSYANTRFITFLDADDWLEPSWAEETLAAWQPGKYVFTDWIDHHLDLPERFEAPVVQMNGKTTSTPDRKPWCGGTWHIVTTLLPLEFAQEVHGFDESLPGMEDTDFYLKLITRFRCGVRLPKALVHYSGAGARSQAFHYSTDHDKVMKIIDERYRNLMGCCGDDQAPQFTVPKGEHLPSDVRARFIQMGNRKYVGRATNRIYERVGNFEVYWVDPRDAQADPHCWRIEDSAPPPTAPQPVAERPPIQSTVDVARVMMTAARRNAPVQATPPPPTPAPAPVAPAPIPTAPPVKATPNVGKVLALGQKALLTKDPVFVLPAKDYPSYTDFFRLVTLSGYQTAPLEQVLAGPTDAHTPYIFATPEPLPDVSGIQGRVIAWQFEYAGDYASNYDGFTGEIWASDPGYAARKGLKFVLLGSHPDLAPSLVDLDKRVWNYDVTMLGYMIPRRVSIKEKLPSLRWPNDYPGYLTEERHEILSSTRIMLQVHQHEQVRALAPQRVALAAAYKMDLVSERVDNDGGIPAVFQPYSKLPATVEKVLSLKPDGEALFRYLCLDHPFMQCVEEALRS